MFEKAGKEGKKMGKGMFVGGKGGLGSLLLPGKAVLFNVTEKQCGTCRFFYDGD